MIYLMPVGLDRTLVLASVWFDLAWFSLGWSSLRPGFRPLVWSGGSSSLTNLNVNPENLVNPV
jgi:hypothetical protein